MSDTHELRADLQRELTQDLSDIRSEFLRRFGSEVTEFIEHITRAYLSWQKLDTVIKDDKKKAYVSALAFTAMNLHIVSFRLFLSGYPVAAGNLQRQVIETLALLILCSEKSFDVLDRYVSDKYSPNKAVRDLRRQGEKLGVNKSAVIALEKEYNFYHQYSHPTPMTMAEQIRFSDHAVFLGAAFDPAKIQAYKKEAKRKVSLARVLGNVIEGAIGNIVTW